MGGRKPGLREFGTQPKLVVVNLAWDETDESPKLGVDPAALVAARQLSCERGSRIEDELLASRAIGEDQLYRAMAEYVSLPFVEAIETADVVVTESIDSQLTEPRLIRLAGGDHSGRIILVPEFDDLETLKARLAASPTMAARMAVTAPSVLRHAVWQAGAAQRLGRVTTGLFDSQPEASARIVLTGRQGFVGGLLLAIGVALLVEWPEPTLLVLHASFSLFYAAQLALRLMAILWVERPAKPATVHGNHDLPVYTVLVALYREDKIVAQLVRRLEQLDWPASRLDIKIVCEADDHLTLEALGKLNMPPHMELVEVPAGLPRTKPRALSYALAGARGDLVVVYDAEDRPHPAQLREAWQAFRSLPGDVACLQAPLIIANARESWISGLFAFEYAGLFRCLLPFLARVGLPLPLGGTSNHFRKSALVACGAWDPFNVTEDADLGLRLYRKGYRTATLHHYTLEDAPVAIRPWLGQRSRWYKGWLQTWLVAMRKPIRFGREMGWRGTLAFHLLMTGLLVSALAHPVVLIILGREVMAAMMPGLLQPSTDPLVWVDLFNLIGSYLVFVMAGRVAMHESERQAAGLRYLLVPFYWLLAAWSAWRAVLELPRKPFFWNKTDHKPVSPSPLRPAKDPALKRKINPAAGHRIARHAGVFQDNRQDCAMKPIRLAELIGALSRALDMTEGQPIGHCVRCAWIGTQVGRQIGLSEQELSDLYYTLMLKDLGCSSNAARICELYLADDLAFKRDYKFVNGSLTKVLGFVLGHTGLKAGMAERFRSVLHIMKHGGEISRQLIETRCQRGAEIARMMRFSEPVAEGILDLDEHWGGGGKPVGKSGHAISLFARIALMVQVFDVFFVAAGSQAAMAEVASRSGDWFDPDLVEALGVVSSPPDFAETLSRPDIETFVLAMEPGQVVAMADEDYMDEIAQAFAKVIDAKSPYTSGHSDRVALFTDMIAEEMGYDLAARRWLNRAALLHDIGKLGVSNSVLDKPGKLEGEEWEAMKRHAEYSETILARISAFSDLSRVAAAHHERLDGKGYPKGLLAVEISMETRIISTADVFDALTADRPYRAAMPVDKALAILHEGAGKSHDPLCIEALEQALKRAELAKVA